MVSQIAVKTHTKKAKAKTIIKAQTHNTLICM